MADLAARLRCYKVAECPWMDMQSPFTAWEAAKMLLLAPLLPLRIAGFITSVLGLGLIVPIISIGCDLDKPLPPLRRRLLISVVQFFCYTLLASCGFVWPRALNAHYVEEGHRMGGFVVFNHVSYLDAFALVWFCGASGVTFDWTTSIPVLGRGIRCLQNLYVPDGPPTSKGARSMTELIKERCVPVLLRYRLAPFNPAWTIITPLWHLVRLMSQFTNGLVVEALPPYVPSAEERADPALYAANVRKLMAKHLGVPLAAEDRAVFKALGRARIGLSWDGRRLLDPKGYLDKEGCLDLTPLYEAPGSGAAAANGAGGGGKKLS